MSFCNYYPLNPPPNFFISRNNLFRPHIWLIRAKTGVQSEYVEDGKEDIGKFEENKNSNEARNNLSARTSYDIDKDISKAVQRTAATFAPRASTAAKNPAVPGTILYTIFEVQGYASMLFGGFLSFNLIFPSNEPDLWRLVGMWSIWMFTIPSLRARDCSRNEKEALDYLFLLIPFLNLAIPFFWKSFALVWSTDTVAFIVMYAWKLQWLQSAKIGLKSKDL